MATRARRIGAQGSDTRARIVEAAEAVIRDEGYAAASTRRVATRAGLQASLIHYYFPTTDDLLLAVFKRGAEQSDAMIETALASDDPLRALWGFFADASRTELALEFMALASHRPLLRAEIARHSEAMRARQAAELDRVIGERLAREGCPPEVLSLILAGIGRALVMEGALGISAGHEETRACLERWLSGLLQIER